MVGRGWTVWIPKEVESLKEGGELRKRRKPTPVKGIGSGGRGGLSILLE